MIKKTTTDVHNRIVLTRDDITRAFKFPSHADVRINVPGGGDWSGMSLDVDNECPVVVSWTETVDRSVEIDDDIPF